jgi:uncharacterized protein
MALITERVLTEGNQTAESRNTIVLSGTNSRSNMISRSVIKGNSAQNFFAVMEAQARCFGHIECNAIGKIANEQLMKLMSLGLTYDEAVNRIIQGFLK